jgi:hypothetical protein
MALTDLQKIDVRMVLGVNYGENLYNEDRWASQALEDVLDALSAAQEDRVADILAEFEKVKFSSGRLTGEFQDDPARKRANLRESMIVVTGFNPDIYGKSNFELGRG